MKSINENQTNKSAATAATWQSINSAAAITGLSRSYIRQGCISGEIPHLMAGKKYMVNLPALLARADALAGVNTNKAEG